MDTWLPEYANAYMCLPLKSLYEGRQHVNKPLYDYCQLYMDIPARKHIFGCRRYAVCQPEVIVVDGSTFAYSRAYEGFDES